MGRFRDKRKAKKVIKAAKKATRKSSRLDKRAQKNAFKLDRKAQKQAPRLARTNKRLEKGLARQDTKAIAYQEGIDPNAAGFQALSNVAGSVGGAVSNIFGKPTARPSRTDFGGGADYDRGGYPPQQKGVIQKLIDFIFGN